MVEICLGPARIQSDLLPSSISSLVKDSSQYSPLYHEVWAFSCSFLSQNRSPIQPNLNLPIVAMTPKLSCRNSGKKLILMILCNGISPGLQIYVGQQDFLPIGTCIHPSLWINRFCTSRPMVVLPLAHHKIDTESLSPTTASCHRTHISKTWLLNIGLNQLSL